MHFENVCNNYVYCYVVCVDDGYYMEPDVSVYRVFLNYYDAIKCCDKIKNSHHNGCFIVKKRLF